MTLILPNHIERMKHNNRMLKQWQELYNHQAPANLMLAIAIGPDGAPQMSCIDADRKDIIEMLDWLSDNLKTGAFGYKRD